MKARYFALHDTKPTSIEDAARIHGISPDHYRDLVEQMEVQDGKLYIPYYHRWMETNKANGKHVVGVSFEAIIRGKQMYFNTLHEPRAGYFRSRSAMTHT